MYSQMYFISVQADLFLFSHFMMYSGLKFLLAPVNEVGSLTKRNWKFLAVSFLPCGMTTIMYPDKGLVQAKGDVFILLTTNSEIDKMQFHCKKLLLHLSLCFCTLGAKIVTFYYIPWFPWAVLFEACIMTKMTQSVKIFIFVISLLALNETLRLVGKRRMRRESNSMTQKRSFLTNQNHHHSSNVTMSRKSFFVG